MEPFRPADFADYDNPYAPPKAALEPDVFVPRSNVFIPFSIDSIMTTSWSIYRDNLWPCIWIFWSVTAVNMGISIALSVAMNTIAGARPNPGSILSLQFALNLVSIIISTWLGIGMNRALIKLVRGEPVTFDLLFSGGRYLFKVIVAGILVFFIIGLIPIVVMAMGIGLVVSQGATGLAIFVGCMSVLACLMLYLAARLMQFFFMIIDRDAGIVESIQLAWELTRGRAGTVILVYFMQILLAVAGFLALCVGLVFTLPLSSLLLVVTYLALVGPPKRPNRMPFTNWDDAM